MSIHRDMTSLSLSFSNKNLDCYSRNSQYEESENGMFKFIKSYITGSQVQDLMNPDIYSLFRYYIWTLHINDSGHIMSQ